MKAALFLLLAATCGLYAQKPAPKLPRQIDVKYDKFKDSTRITLDLIAKSRNRPLFIASETEELYLNASYDGSALKENVADFYMVFYGRCCYHRDEEIIFLIDGERLKKTGYVSRDLEGVSFELTRDEIERMAAAKTIEFQITGKDLAIQPKDMALIKTFLELATKK